MNTLGKIFIVLFIAAFVFTAFFEGFCIFKERSNLPAKGQHFDLRGGSTVIEVNPSEKVVWFRCDKDSTYFYEPFRNIGIQ